MKVSFRGTKLCQYIFTEHCDRTQTIFLFLLQGISTVPAAVTHTQPIAHGDTKPCTHPTHFNDQTTALQIS